MKQYKLRQGPVSAVQWKPGANIPGVVAIADIYPNLTENTTDALWINPGGENVRIIEGWWLVFGNGPHSKPELVVDEIFQNMYELMDDK